MEHTKGRMPTITFSDDADYDTLNAVLFTPRGENGDSWVARIVTKDGLHYDLMLNSKAPADFIGGSAWQSGEWRGNPVWIHLDDVAEIIIH